MKSFSDENDPQDADVTVEPGQWRQASGDQTIGTYGLGPCAGVAIFDPARYIGYMVHTAGPEAHTVRDMARAAIQQAMAPNTLRAWAGGASFAPGAEAQEQRELIEDNRAAVVECLLEVGILEENLEVAWTDNPDIETGMLLECATGVCHIIQDEEGLYGDY